DADARHRPQDLDAPRDRARRGRGRRLRHLSLRPHRGAPARGERPRARVLRGAQGARHRDGVHRRDDDDRRRHVGGLRAQVPGRHGDPPRLHVLPQHAGRALPAALARGVPARAPGAHPQGGPTMAKAFLFLGAIVMALGVAAGAFSAHAAKGAVHPDAARLLQTAVLYHLVNGLGIVAVALVARAGSSTWLAAAGVLLAAGIVLFCGALWILAMSGRSMGPMAPTGGLAFIVGWIALAIHALTR